MTWWQFSLDCRAAELEQVEDLMASLGALSISIRDAADEPIYEPLPGTTPVWQESVVTATFDAASDPDELQTRIAAALPSRLKPGLRRGSLQDRDWEQTYRQHFKPLRCAPGLWIVPSWTEPPDKDAVVVRLDPGLAFGTGTHPTTALCLGWLADHPPTGERVIDYGCGSGILAIAACKLGARQVLAIDIDAQALEACAANRQRNEIGEDRLRISAPHDAGPGVADLLIANILAAPLIELAPRFAGMLRGGGRILLSGLLESQLEDIQSAYRGHFEFEAASRCDEWVCVAGTRQEDSADA
jgi:ribosomal protein L11 methyltransferase